MCTFIFTIILTLCVLLDRFDPWKVKFSAFLMGNSKSSGFAASTPKRLSWGRRKEDTVKLYDILSSTEEDLWRAKRKQRLAVKKIHFTHNISYVDLGFQDNGTKSGESINSAFVEESSQWVYNTVGWETFFQLWCLRGGQLFFFSVAVN